MAITEIIIPLLKQDAASKSAFNSIVKPLLSSIVKVAPGAKLQAMDGRTISENNNNVEEAFRPIMGIGKAKILSSIIIPSLTSTEWQAESNFHDFIKSKDFESFAVNFKPLAAGPPQLQVFETDQGPGAVFSSRLTEAFRVNIGDSKKAAEAQHVWKFFTGALERKVQGIKSISGTSLNLEEKLFVGIIGWEGAEVCVSRMESL
jgi:hypothetical protein